MGIDISCKRVPSSTKVQHFCILLHATLDSRDFRFLLCHSLLNESPSAGPKAKDAHTSTARMVLGIRQSLVKSFARKSGGQSVVCNWDKMQCNRCCHLGSSRQQHHHPRAKSYTGDRFRYQCQRKCLEIQSPKDSLQVRSVFRQSQSHKTQLDSLQPFASLGVYLLSSR